VVPPDQCEDPASGRAHHRRCHCRASGSSRLLTAGWTIPDDGTNVMQNSVIQANIRLTVAST
jgi:hypothetical protein